MENSGFEVETGQKKAYQPPVVTDIAIADTQAVEFNDLELLS